MKWTGKLLGGIIGLFVTRGPLGALLGVIIGHLYDQKSSAPDRDDPELGQASAEAGNTEAVAARFFRCTFEVMGHVAKSDGRVSEQEIAAARKVMSDFRLNEAQTDLAIEHFRLGKDAAFDLEQAVLALRKACAGRPDLMRAFIEIQVRAALEGSDLNAPVRARLGRVATLFGISSLEFAHLEAILRLRRGHAQRGGTNAAGAARSTSMEEAYKVLEIEASASNDEVEKAYRRQLSRNHPDKLKANGLPESMLEHAKQRTQQIIEAWDLIRERRGIKT
jgi:DnaJ like chaperone protein